MKKLLPSKEIDEQLVFIIASPRSGTHWLQRMIASASPQIVTGPESFLFGHYIAPQLVSWKNDKGLKTGLSVYFTENEFFNQLRNYWYDLLKTITGKLKPNQLYLDKTSSNALVAPDIKQLFPKCKMIHVIRDPRDTIASLHHARKTWASYHDDPDTTSVYIDMWKQSVNNAQEIKKSSATNEFIEVRYENLLNNTQQELKKVLSFLNIKISDKKISKIIQDHSFKNIKQGKGYKLTLKGEVGGKKGKIWQEPKGFFRKGKVGSWKKDLTLYQKMLIKIKLSKTMKERGYRW